MAAGGDPVSVDSIVTEYEDRPNTVYITQRPATAVLPDGRRIRLGDVVTGLLWGRDPVCGAVIGWDSECFVINPGDAASLELAPQEILTIEAAR